VLYRGFSDSFVVCVALRNDDEQLTPATSSSCHRRISMRISNSTHCHKNVILIVVNGGKMQTKGEQRRRKGFIGFSRNLLISFDYGQLRQVLMKLVVRLLTEGLLVRI
jgi:hypothetical protein